MRRLALIGLTLTVAVGCDFGAGRLSHQSTLYQQTNGVALRGRDDFGSDRAQVGMMQTTCEVDLAWASLGADYDYPGTDETVQDADADKVVITNDDKVFVQEGVDWYGVGTDEYVMPGVDQARISGDSIVGLVDSGAECSVRWVGATAATHLLENGACSESYQITADPTTGGVYVASDNGVTFVTPGSSEVVTEQPTDIVEWDPVADVLYAAELGDSMLLGLEADGSQRFATDLGGSIIALDDMGARASAAVSVQYANGMGALVIVDGYTGAIVDGMDTPTAADAVEGSPDGRSLALVEPGQVHFYGFGSLMDQWASDSFDSSFDSDWESDW